MDEAISLGGDAAKARLLLDLSGLPYFEVDAQRNVVRMSPAMGRLTGFDADDIIGRSCLRLHRCEECLKGCGVFDEGVVRDKHLELYRSDGTLVEVSKSGRVFLDQDGNITGAIEVVKPTNPALVDSDEARRLQTALHKARYRRSEAARALGISRTTLWRKMREYGL